MTPTPERELVGRLRGGANYLRCEGMVSLPGALDEAASRIESLEAERDGLRRTLDSVLDTNPSGDCWCDSGHEHAGTVCMGCWARGRRPKQSPLARMAESILTAGYPRSQCDPRNDPSSEIQ